MTDKKLATDSYKGVRDFYPEDASIQQYIFDTWRKTAESFGFERYDASILEPAELYKSKGAENEELVNEQTYTFTDRGEREVTLRPEMTPTVARMVAGKARELAFPLRWYSIPNLFRYERPQKGRLREHWQFNCDIFGSDSIAADVEIVALAYQTLINFGVKPEQFVILINDRQMMERLYVAIGLTPEMIKSVTHLNDRKNKISEAEYKDSLNKITNDETLAEEVVMLLDKSDEQTDIVIGLEELGIANVIFDKSLARGFDYYTGTIFEVFETDENGKPIGRAILGGGRYDNLTSMFGGEPISGIGFGMGDVALCDLLEKNNLININSLMKSTIVTVIPEMSEQNLFAETIAKQIRELGISVSTDIGTQKPEKKKARASDRGSTFIIVVGEKEIESGNLTVKNLLTGEEKTGKISDLMTFLKAK